MASFESKIGKQNNPKTFKAMFPFQVINRTSPLRLRCRISPDAEIVTRLDLSPVIAAKRRGWASKEGAKSTLMRRTASLDAIYLKDPNWLKEQRPHYSLLLLDKATQTPEEWVSCSLADLSSVNEVDSGGSWANANGSSHNSRKSSDGVAHSPWPIIVAQQPPTTPPAIGDNIEKFIRQRLQRTNKEGYGIVGSRSSPVPADHSVLAPSPLLSRPYACVQANVCQIYSCDGMPKSTNAAQLPRPLLPRFRSSVEDLNQEIERLILKPSYQTSPDEDEDENCKYPDGRRAPFPDYFRQRRSVNTQTPARCSSGASANSSTRSSPSLSPAVSPYSAQGVVTPPDSPDPPKLPPTFSSPQINKFFAREPPDGCERVAWKSTEEMTLTSASIWPPVKPTPTAVFTLLPSLGSAFCAPGRNCNPDRVLLNSKLQRRETNSPTHYDNEPPKIQ